MKRILLYLLIFGISPAFAQDAAPADTIWTTKDLDVQPDYPGGVKAFYTYIAKTYQYPPEARQANAQGRVQAEFVIEKDGSISNCRVVKHLGYNTDKELLRVLLTNASKWVPGQKNGQAVRVKHSALVTLNLSVSSPAMPGSSPSRRSNTTWY